MQLESFFEKTPDYLSEKYRDDHLFRALATRLFSHQMSFIDGYEHPGAIKVGELDEETKKLLMSCIDRKWFFIDKLDSNLSLAAFNAKRIENYKSAEQTENVMILSKGYLSNPNFKPEEPMSKYPKFTKDNFVKLKPIIDYVDNFAKTVGNGEVRSIVLVRLGPHKKVPRHFDRDARCMVRDRYHIVLKCKKQKQSFGYNESEIYSFHENDIWWYNNTIIHKAENESDEERIHIMIDITPFKNLKFEKIMTESNFEIKDYEIKEYQPR